MEENFIKFMIEKMRKSVPTTEKDSTAQSYYKSLIDQERAKIMASTNGGIGLQKLILEQISPYAKQAYQKAAKGIPNEQR